MLQYEVVRFGLEEAVLVWPVEINPNIRLAKLDEHLDNLEYSLRLRGLKLKGKVSLVRLGSDRRGITERGILVTNFDYSISSEWVMETVEQWHRFARGLRP